MMILKSTQEKIDFLKGCLVHIDQIFNHFQRTKRKPRDISLYKKDSTDPQEATILSNKKLPRTIIINGNIPAKNVDVGKLLVLTSLYNNVADQIMKESSVDLKNEFNKVKQDLYFTLVDSGLPSADILMKKHRHHFLKDGVLGYILSFIWTSNPSNFLKKYEFFTKKSDLEDDFNFRHELATNCNFDVNLISQIEPTLLGLGYIIKANSTEEASIIMSAIQKQLSEEELEDTIRFIDTKSMSSKNEGSSTIEVWGQAVDMLENLSDTNQRKYY